MRRLFSMRVAILVLAFGMFVLGAKRPTADCVKCRGLFSCIICNVVSLL